MALATASAEPNDVIELAAPLAPRLPRVRLGRSGVWLLTLLISLGAIGAGLPLVGADPIDGGLAIPWWALLAGFAVAEVLVVHLTFGRHSVSFSMSEIPITLAFGAIAPLGALAVRVVGSVIGLVTQRVRGVRLAFNVASAALETVAATLVYRSVLGDAHPLDMRGWTAALVALLVVDLVSGATIMAAMSLDEGRLDLRSAPEIAISGVVAATTNCCLAVITLIVLDRDPRAGLALVVVAGIVMVAYRAWTVQARRYGHMEALYDFTRALADEDDVVGLVRLALVQAKQLTGAGHAELFIEGPTGSPGTRWTMTAGSVDVELDATCRGGDWWSDTSGPFCAPSGSKDADVRRCLDQLGRKDALIAPLRSSRGSHGALLVADRNDNVSTFKPAELKLLETLASHVAVELDNARLVERLRVEAADKAHLALHDLLTGLPNRRWFTSSVREALAAGGPVSVLLMDLDRFKEINDTLGHAAGDRVLAAVSLRLREALGGNGSLARFGGDEFAVLLRLDATDDVLAAAEILLAALQAPVSIDHMAVDIGASIGAAIAPFHGTEPDTLVQHADVAMYVAKDRQSGFEMYSYERDVNDIRRLNLVSELRRAINSGSIDVHYQPQVAVTSDSILGVEALARWTSEQYGPVPPDEFIPIAECTGLIGALTDHVLQTALRDCATWWANGWKGTISVNLSARSLLDQDLPSKVIAQLERAGMPPEALTLEITETSIMRDPDRNIELLGRLSEIGIRLSVDDFGIGYSSLSYLKRLPLRELKIDRSFVTNLEWDEGDQAIVRATIRLGHDLGLSIVAEGVETQSSLRLLKSWGIDVAQGYYFGRPVAAEDIGRRLARPTLTIVKRHAG